MDLLGTTSKIKNDTLDPLSVIIKLFIYAHKQVGTKLSIGSNRIHIQEPGVFQGTVRKYYGDKKNDVNIIFFPIIFACKHYLGNKKLRARFLHLFGEVVGSFDKLKETYQGNEIIYNIDQLKSIAQNFIANEAFDPNTLYSSYDSPGGKIKQGIYSHINTIWNESRLNVIFGMIEEILQTTTTVDIRSGMVNALNIYMGCVDMLTFNLITNL